MSKKCKVSKCNYPVFSEGYCKYHQYMRTDEKAKKQRENYYNKKRNAKKIKPQSEKRKKMDVIYHYTKEEFIEQKKEENEYYCIFCGNGFSKTPDIHHLKGRDDDLLIKPKYWGLAHRGCHSQYHDNPPSACSWFEDYIDRIKEIDLQLYYIEQEKYKRSKLNEQIKKE